MSRVVEINSVEHLEPYRLVWASLWRRTRQASFTQTLDWFGALFEHDPDAIRPRVLIVFDDDDEAIGILPLLVREEATAFGRVRVLGYPLSPLTELCGPVGSLSTVTLIEGLKHVAQTPRDWDHIDLRGIDASNLDSGRTKAALGMNGLAATLEPCSDRSVVELGNDWNDYWRSRDPQRRGRIDQMARKLERGARVSHVRYRPDGTMHGDDDPRWDLYTDCLTVARRSWQAGDRRGVTLSTPARADLFRQAHLAAVRAGTLDVNVLYVDGKPAAFAYNYAVGGVVARAMTGYAREFTAAGVGTILTWKSLRDSHERGDRTIDFGATGADWKRFWATRTVATVRVAHVPPWSWKSNLLRWGRSLRRALRAG